MHIKRLQKSCTFCP